MIKDDTYQYLRIDMPNLQDRKKYCQRLLDDAIKKSKDSPLFMPIPIRIQPSKDTKYNFMFKSVVVDNNISGVLIVMVRNKIKLSKSQALYLYAGDLLVNYNSDLKTLYEKKKDPDGFLYVTYG